MIYQKHYLLSLEMQFKNKWNKGYAQATYKITLTMYNEKEFLE